VARAPNLRDRLPTHAGSPSIEGLQILPEAADACGVPPHLASVVDDHAVDPHAAAAVLARLTQRSRDAAMAAALALVIGLGLVLLGYDQIALPAGAGALTGLFVAAVARGERGALVARLIGQRSAYQIPEVARAAARMACMARRHELARALARLVFVAEGIEPATVGLDGIAERILPHSDDLLGLAFLIASDGVKVHPATLALLDRLLGSTARSPLYSRAIPEQHLRIAIQRMRASIDA
jgi:hypothetical protein